MSELNASPTAGCWSKVVNICAVLWKDEVVVKEALAFAADVCFVQAFKAADSEVSMTEKSRESRLV